MERAGKDAAPELGTAYDDEVEPGLTVRLDVELGLEFGTGSAGTLGAWLDGGFEAM